MKVKELIEALKKLDPKAMVWIEGEDSFTPVEISSVRATTPEEWSQCSEGVNEPNPKTFDTGVILISEGP